MLYNLNVFKYMKQYALTLAYSTVAVLSICVQFEWRIGLGLVVAGLVTWKTTHLLIPKISKFMLKAEIFGLDINKKGSEAG